MAKAGKMNPQTIKTILAVLRRGRDITTAARLAEVSRQSIYNLMDRSKRFRQAVEEAKAYALDCVVGAIWDNATGQPIPSGHRSPNIAAAIYWTKNRDPRNWCDKRELDHSGELTLAQLIAGVDKEIAEKDAEASKRSKSETPKKEEGDP